MMPYPPGGILQRSFGRIIVETVLSHRPSALWTRVKMKPPGRVRRMKIACAVDLHEDGGRVALDAAFLARTLDARLAMIHALPRLDEGVILFAAGDDLPSTLNENAARRELASICPPSQECPDPLITRGEPPQAIRNALRKLDADLLVVGPGRQPPGEMKLGSHVFDIVRPAAVHDAEIAHDRDCAAA